MTALTLSFVQDALQVPLNHADEQIVRILTDSRQIQSGDVFVALVGEQFDGHDYVADVLAKGAVAVIVSRDVMDDDVRQIMVADTLAALGQIAHAWRMKLNPKVIALTGSSGKTTVKEMVAAILRVAWGKEAVLATAGNFNNEIGMPLTILRLQDAHQVMVLEMGMNHFGEIQRLSRIAQPDVVLVNNALRAHIGNDFNGVDDIARAKSEIYSGLKPSGMAILPADDAHFAIFQDAAQNFAQTTFGLAHGDIHAKNIVLSPLASDFIVTDGQEEVAVHLPVAGEHNVYNAVAAVSLVRALGVQWECIAQGLATFANVKGRLQGFASASGAWVIDDTYNANPDSMKAALDVLSRFDGSKVFVMGAIGELGEDAPNLHAEVGQYANQIGLQALFGLGENARFACDACEVGQYFEDAEALIEALREYNMAGNTLLVKGSRFMKMERVVEALLSAADE